MWNYTVYTWQSNLGFIENRPGSDRINKMEFFLFDFKALLSTEYVQKNEINSPYSQNLIIRKLINRKFDYPHAVLTIEKQNLQTPY